MAPPDDDRHLAMEKLAEHLDQLAARKKAGENGTALDGAVEAFAARVQRLERELRDLRGMLEGIGAPRR